MSRLTYLRHTTIFFLSLVLAIVAVAQSTIVPTGKTATLSGKKYYIHVVEQGQTVFSIARAYGLHYASAVIRTDIQHINVGDTVWLPINAQSRAAVQKATGREEAQASYSTITVKPKQTLYGIAKEYGVTIEAIEALNPELKAGGLKAGQTLKIPTSTSSSNRSNSQELSNRHTQVSERAQNPEEGQFRYRQPQPQQPETQPQAPQQPATQTSIPTVRERVNRDKVCVSLLLPLNLSRIDEISTTKFDVDQRGKRDYKSFEFIQFYEGILLALDELQSLGCSVKLNVVDVSSDKEEDIVQLYNSHNVAQSDFAIALLQRSAFSVVAKLAKRDHLFLVNPMSDREEILANNPYIIKYTPSVEGKVRAMLSEVASSYKGAHLYIMHSGGKDELPMYKELEKQLKERGNIAYTLYDWSMNGKLASVMKGTPSPVVISIYDRGRDKNRIYTNQLLNRLCSLKSNMPTLITATNLINDIPDVDYNQLQNLSYTMVYYTYLDYNNPVHKNFVDRFKNRFKTEPLGGYAAVAHDILLYFSQSVNIKGVEFWSNLSSPSIDGMLFPIHLKQASATSGIENQSALVYKMQNFQLRPTH